MAVTSLISSYELQRVAIRAYEGRTLRVHLCNLGTEGYDENTPVAAWLNTEVGPAYGYQAADAVIQTGSYDPVLQAYIMPSIDAVFVATGGVYTWNTVLLYIDDPVLTGTIVSGTNIAFNAVTNQITRATGDFTLQFLANTFISISGTTGGLNDGVYRILSVTPGAITLASETSLSATQSTGPTVQLQTADQYPYGILQENPNLTLASGQVQTYRINLLTNDDPF